MTDAGDMTDAGEMTDAGDTTDAGDMTDAGDAADIAEAGETGLSLAADTAEAGETGSGLTMLSLDTEKSRSALVPLALSLTVMPGTSRLVAPAMSGSALAVETAPAAMTPSPRAEAAPMAIQFFACMMVSFRAAREAVRVRISAPC